mmetsp:Transcript_53351/g.141873  ORF Transcript_53351/g.141873 Transcript_53351/m.141873 type:complete len:544 (-) Transcript_53351:309-1940(-)
MRRADRAPQPLPLDRRLHEERGVQLRLRPPRRRQVVRVRRAQRRLQLALELLGHVRRQRGHHHTRAHRREARRRALLGGRRRQAVGVARLPKLEVLRRAHPTEARVEVLARLGVRHQQLSVRMARKALQQLLEVDVARVVGHLHLVEEVQLLGARHLQHTARPQPDLEAERQAHPPQQHHQLVGGDVAGALGVELLPLLAVLLEDAVGHLPLLVARRAGEVLEDDGDDEVEQHEAADEREGDKVDERDPAGAAAVLGVRAASALLRDHAVVHQAVPRLAGDGAEEQHDRLRQRAEVGLPVDEGARVRDVREEVDAQHGVDEEEQEQQARDVEEARQGADERGEQVAQAGRRADEAQQTADAEDAQHAQDGGVEGGRVGGGELDDDVEQRGEHEEEVEEVPPLPKVVGAVRAELDEHLHHEDGREGVIGDLRPLLARLDALLLHVVGHAAVRRHQQHVDGDQAHHEPLEAVGAHEPPQVLRVRALRLERAAWHGFGGAYHRRDPLALPLREQGRALLLLLDLGEVVDDDTDEEVGDEERAHEDP